MKKKQRSVVALQGQHGIKEEVFLSLPCVVGTSGISHIFKQKLDEREAEKLRHSASTLRTVMDNIQW